MKDDREELEARIAAFLDGQLPPDEAARLEVFLANTDHDLAARVISMVRDKSAVQSLPKPKAPDDLTARIMESAERASLLHGVEHLAHPHRRWWQSHGALAAGLILVLGGFTYFIVQSFYRPDSPWQNFVDHGAAGPLAHGVAANDALRNTKTAQLTKANDLDAAKQTEVLALAKSGAPGGSGGSAAGDVQGKAALSQTIAAAPADEAEVEKQLARAQETVNAPYDAALKKGYLGADSPQAALAAVNADTRHATTASPILLTLVARDALDPQRLRTLLEQFMAQDASLTTQQLALFQRVTTGGSFTNGSLAGSGTLTLNGTLDLNGGTLTSGPIASAGGTVINKGTANSGGNTLPNGVNTYTGGTTISGGTLTTTNAPDPNLNTKSGANYGTFAGTIQPATQAAQLNIASKDQNDYTRQSPGTNTLNTLQDQQFANNKTDLNGNTAGNGNFAYNLYSPRDPAFNPVANGTANINGGNLTLNNNNDAPTAGNLTAQNTGQNSAQYNTQNVTRAPAPTGNYAQGQSESQSRLNLSRNSNALTGGQAPFRLMLRPSQLNEIAGKFQVHSVTRGTSAYVVNNDRYAGYNARQQGQIANANQSETKKFETTRDTHEGLKSAASPAAAGPPAAPAAEPALPAPTIANGERSAKATAELRTPTSSVAAKSARDPQTERRLDLKARPTEESPKRAQLELTESERFKESAGQQAQRPEPALRPQPAPAREEEQLIECIITIEPAPPDNASQFQLDTNLQRNAK